MSDAARAGQSDRPQYLFPEQATAEERAEMDRTLDVDTVAYLRWLAGDGPDPCLPASFD